MRNCNNSFSNAVNSAALMLNFANTTMTLAKYIFYFTIAGFVSEVIT